IGVIWEVYNTAPREFGFRKNGSSDDRHGDAYLGNSWAIIGCDASHIKPTSTDDRTEDLNTESHLWAMVGVDAS
ncbi:unnamed protein product, partial [marine sediment metagenome]